jgi:hypothetical protein
MRAFWMRERERFEWAEKGLIARLNNGNMLKDKEKFKQIEQRLTFERTIEKFWNKKRKSEFDRATTYFGLIDERILE